MKYFIDRITDGVAVLEDENGNQIEISPALLPEDAREGSAVQEKDGEYLPDEDAENDRRKKLFELQNKLKAKKRSGST